MDIRIYKPGELVRPVGTKNGFRVRVIGDNGCTVRVASVNDPTLIGSYAKCGPKAVRLELVSA